MQSGKWNEKGQMPGYITVFKNKPFPIIIWRETVDR